MPSSGHGRWFGSTTSRERHHRNAFQRRYRVADKTLRGVLIVFFLVTGIQSLVGNGLWEAGHVAWKAIVFVIVIGG